MSEIFLCCPQCQVQIIPQHKNTPLFNSHRTKKKTRLPLPSTTWIHPDTEVRDSTIIGQGIFVTRAILKNETVLICGGQLFRNHEVHTGKARPQSLTGFAEGLYIGAPSDAPQGMDEYLNHSCDPNLWLKDEVTIISRREVRPGQELTVDYATWEIDESWRLPDVCNCGSRYCRHVITGMDWKLSCLQSRYKNHFLPCLNERIRKQRMLQRYNRFAHLLTRIVDRVNQIRFPMFQKPHSEISRRTK